METNAVAADRQSDELEEDSEYSRGIAKLQSLLTQGRVEEARCLVRQLEANWPESELVRRFSRVLAPPTAHVASGGSKAPSREQTQKEGAWLREHALEYPGCWVILNGDRLIAAHPKLRNAIQEANHLVAEDVGSIYYLPPAPVEE